MSGLNYAGATNAGRRRPSNDDRWAADPTTISARPFWTPTKSPPAEAAAHPMRATVTRHVGMTPPAAPDFLGARLQSGDRVLLCTDGLNNAVDDASLAAVLAAHPDPAQACATLITAANQAGGRDNVTVLIVDMPPPAASAA